MCVFISLISRFLVISLKGCWFSSFCSLHEKGSCEIVNRDEWVWSDNIRSLYLSHKYTHTHTHTRSAAPRRCPALWRNNTLLQIGICFPRGRSAWLANTQLVTERTKHWFVFLLIFIFFPLNWQAGRGWDEIGESRRNTRRTLRWSLRSWSL